MTGIKASYTEVFEVVEKKWPELLTGIYTFHDQITPQKIRALMRRLGIERSKEEIVSPAILCQFIISKSEGKLKLRDFEKQPDPFFSEEPISITTTDKPACENAGSW